MTLDGGENQGAVRIVLCTCPERESLHLAHALVDRRVAACVNIVPQITSVYIWEGKVCEEKETLLVIKTSDAMVGELRDTILEVHTYSVPEILVLDTESGESHGDYVQWVIDTVSPVARGAE